MYIFLYMYMWGRGGGASQVALVIKNPHLTQETEEGSISGLEDPLEEGMAIHFGILA